MEVKMNKKVVAIILLVFFVFAGAVAVYAATKCSQCNGRGWVVCRICDGSGRLYNKLHGTCGGTGKLTCNACRGIGRR